MFELEQYSSKGHFFFSSTDDLKSVCNAPKTGMGVYLIHALKNGRIDLVYVGASGKIAQNGEVKIRQGGIYDRLVNGKQFGGPRSKSWKQKLEEESIEALDIYWFITFDITHVDIPCAVEGRVIQEYFQLHGKLPEWNKEF